ncbi:MAG TPA: hypothetical protein VGE07_18465 [Herpetosiphonaceae bacterium]
MITVHLIQSDDTPLDAGVTLELLGDGQPIASGTVDSRGAVEFDVAADRYQRLAIRLRTDQQPAPGA